MMDAKKRHELEEILRQRAALPPEERWALLARDMAGGDEAQIQAQETDTWLEEVGAGPDDSDGGVEPATHDDGGEIAFVAYQDRGDADGMAPLSDEDGHLVTFATYEEAKRAARALGVAAPQTALGLRMVCRQYRLCLPRKGNGRG